ncbi:unknown [Clostridium sp. CAG:448]|nr:unknown [Clostridium sp. CAG:448]
MLSAAVDSRKGLFVQKADQTVLQSDFLHDFHRELVVVSGNIGCRINRCQFVLCRRHFIVFRLGKNPQLPQFLVQLCHICRHTGFDNAEIMIIQFLSLGRLCAKQGAPRIDQILALFVHFAVHQKILLFRSDACTDTFHRRITEQAQNPHCLLAQCFHRTEKRCFFIQRLSSVRAESSGNAQAFVFDECIGCGVPCGIAARFKGCAQPPGRERGGIRLTLDQFLPGKFHNHPAVRRRCNKRVMLFRRNAGQWLKPVGKMCRAVRNCPILHRHRNRIGYLIVQTRTFVNGFFE